MDKDKLHNELQRIADQIVDIVRQNMADAPPSKHGDSLVGSKLYKSVNAKAIEYDKISFEIANYWMYVNSGRRAGKGIGPPYLVDGITRWVREKGIRWQGKTENQVIWAIVKSIWENGVKARPFAKSSFIPKEEVDNVDSILPFLDIYIDEWMENLFNIIIENLDNYFNK